MQTLSPTGIRFDQAAISPSIGIPGVATASSGQAHLSAANPLTLRNAINTRLGSRKIGKGGGKKGVLITIDETQAASYDDAVAIATAIQHVIADTDESDIPDADKKAWR